MIKLCYMHVLVGRCHIKIQHFIKVIGTIKNTSYKKNKCPGLGQALSGRVLSGMCKA